MSSPSVELCDEQSWTSRCSFEEDATSYCQAKRQGYPGPASFDQ
jgi:hypothetical protein